MKTRRTSIVALAALLGIGMLVASADTSPARANGLGLDWVGNTDYVHCLQFMQSISHGGGIWGPTHTGADQATQYDKGRRVCNKTYYPGRSDN